MIETRRKYLLDYVISWSLMSTFHCYSKIFQYKLVLARLFWSICFLLLASLTCCLVIKCYMNFVEYDVVTKIKLITERPITFPTVTICDSNPFTTEFSQNLLRNISLQAFGKEVQDMSFDDVLKNLTNVAMLTKMMAANAKFNFTKNLSQPIVIKGCKFNKIECNSSLDFKEVYLYDNGVCKQFNSNGPNLKEVSQIGKDFGLSLILGPMNSMNKYPTSDSKGLVVFIHNQTFEPISSEGIQVRMGENTFISLKKTVSKNEPTPYSDCNDLSDGFESELYKFIIKSKKLYRQSDCFNLCFQRVVTMRCGCFFTKYPMFVQAKPCLNLTQLECIYIYERGYAQNYSTKCLSECPLECESVTYDHTVTSLDFPTKEFYETTLNDKIMFENLFNYFGQNFTLELYKENFLSLNVFLSSSKYTLITETPKITLTDLITNLGGSVGILLGCSMFSLLEVLELLFQCFLIAVYKKKID